MKSLLVFYAALSLAGIASAQTAPLPAPLPTPLPAPTPSNEPPVDYAGAIWMPAAQGNFDPQNRPQSQKIDMVVVHDIEGPASAGINIFQRVGAGVSAHYIVGGDGQVWQMVREHNVGWHAGNRNINHRSIGIETEGYAYRPGWYGTAMYEAQARLVRDITRRHNIPRDRTHIIGHAEVPNPRDPTRFGGGSGHTDPGPYWNWATFMTLVRNDARLVEALIPVTIRPGEVLPASVTLQNFGDDPWPANTARNPKTALQSSGPIVVLGTEQGRVSPLFNLQGWISPTVAAGASTDTLPGTSANFDFMLRGPRELGNWSDQLRLTTMPTAAQGGSPVSFGDKVPIATRVVPWVMDVPSPNATVKVVLKRADGSVVNGPLARWDAQLRIGGIYAVYAAPPRPAKTRGEKPFSYRIQTIDGDKSVQARPEDGGRGWLFAGYFRFPEPRNVGAISPELQRADAVTVELQSAPLGINEKNAGAVRFVGPFLTVPNTPPDISQIPNWQMRPAPNR